MMALCNFVNLFLLKLAVFCCYISCDKLAKNVCDIYIVKQKKNSATSLHACSPSQNLQNDTLLNTPACVHKIAIQCYSCTFIFVAKMFINE